MWSPEPKMAASIERRATIRDILGSLQAPERLRNQRVTMLETAEYGHLDTRTQLVPIRNLSWDTLRDERW